MFRAMALKLSTSLLVLLGCVRTVAGNAFLQRSIPRSAKALTNRSEVELRLLEEVQGYVGKGRKDLQLPAIQKALEPMWLALPKNKFGGLNTPQVRYALHRFFVQRHGWRVDGLDRMGQHVDGSLVGGLLKDRVPAFLMDRFEEAFGQTGLNLQELSMFAATLEHIIHDDAASRLHEVYDALQLSTNSLITREEADNVTYAYLISMLLGMQRLQEKPLEVLLPYIARVYSDWAEMKLWVHDARHTVEYLDQGRVNPFVANDGFSFHHAKRVIDYISRDFGNFHASSCQDLKNTLLEAEDGKSGRVLLSKFYKLALERKKYFKETVEGLRNYGALDEDRAGEPRVVVSNYILAHGNCLAHTGFHSICCMSECEGLLGHIERTVAAPEADPDTIARIVSNLSSSTVDAPLTLPEHMLERLGMVASRHGGKVPLHGRLFSQWLHVAFPRECPYPHASGSSAGPLTAAEWMKTSNPLMQDDRMEEYIDSVDEQPNLSQAQGQTDEVVAAWSHEEELFYMSPEKPGEAGGLGAALPRAAAAFATGVGMWAAAMELAKRYGIGSQVYQSSCGRNSEKAHLV